MFVCTVSVNRGRKAAPSAELTSVVLTLALFWVVTPSSPRNHTTDSDKKGIRRSVTCSFSMVSPSALGHYPRDWPHLAVLRSLEEELGSDSLADINPSIAVVRTRNSID